MDVIFNVHLIHLTLIFPTSVAKSRFIFAKYSFMLNLAFKQNFFARFFSLLLNVHLIQVDWLCFNFPYMLKKWIDSLLQEVVYKKKFLENKMYGVESLCDKFFSCSNWILMWWCHPIRIFSLVNLMLFNFVQLNLFLMIIFKLFNLCCKMCNYTQCCSTMFV